MTKNQVPFWYTVYSKIHGKYTDCDNEARYKIAENYITQWHRKNLQLNPTRTIAVTATTLIGNI